MNDLDKDIIKLRKDKDVLMSLDRLMVNPDFKKVIMKDFLVDHPLALIEGKGVLKLDPQTNQDIDRQLDCVALFRMYLNSQVSSIADIDLHISSAETLRDEQTRNT